MGGTRYQYLLADKNVVKFLSWSGDFAILDGVCCSLVCLLFVAFILLVSLFVDPQVRVLRWVC